jgi:NDP-sugar pyrophosphorylase family protein
VVKPILVVMAAGMGSRYGGLKQIDPMGPNGEIIMDCSIYDALKAGFGKVVFVIKKDIEELFREKIGNKVEKLVDTEYVYQRLEDVPKGFAVPQERVKPWGTAHAVMSCRNAVDKPFAVINADDFYSRHAFQVLHDYLKDVDVQMKPYPYCMVGFQVENTLTEHGHVARGVCTVGADGSLKGIQERTRIEKFGNSAKYTEDGETWINIPYGSMVSMNTWGFTPSLFQELDERFPSFLQANTENILKAEFFLPTVVDSLISEGKAGVKVLPCRERWYGVTYQQDKPVVRQALKELILSGLYPENLWEVLHD